MVYANIIAKASGCCPSPNYSDFLKKAGNEIAFYEKAICLANLKIFYCIIHV
jgi:hypothetical protein